MREVRSFRFASQGAAYWGVIWGIGVGMIEYLVVAPIDDWGSVRQLVFWLLYWMMPYWCAIGCLLVWLADQYESTASKGRFLATFIALCALAAGLQPLLSILLIGVMSGLIPGFQRWAAATGAVQPSWGNWSALSLYQLWATLFYGGLLAAARIFTVRADRSRHLLHQNAMARSRTETLLDAARLQTLQSQIDPSLLLDSMRELQQRYATSPERAERLLEALVEFLRYAMHGLRVPASTLEAELQLARAYAQLQQERGLEDAWRILEEAPRPSVPFKFPSLLILPLMALGGDGGCPILQVHTKKEQTCLSLRGLTKGISGELRQQISTRLYALYGQRFILESPSPKPYQVDITLFSHPTQSGESHA